MAAEGAEDGIVGDVAVELRLTAVFCGVAAVPVTFGAADVDVKEESCEVKGVLAGDEAGAGVDAVDFDGVDAVGA